MKKVKLFWRFVTILMISIMLLGIPNSALAEEPITNNSERIEIVIGSNETAEIDLQEVFSSGDAISTGIISPGQTGSADGYLDPYFGLYKTIHFSAIYCGNSGNVQCIFANTDGHDDVASCILTASEMDDSKNIWGAHSGNYRLTVTNYSSADCAVACYW